MNVLSWLALASPWHCLFSFGGLARDIASTTQISILPPSPSNSIVLLKYLEVYIPQSQRDPDTKIYTRITCSYDSDFQRPKILNWLVFDGERGGVWIPS
jgi:hypothetical protein